MTRSHTVCKLCCCFIHFSTCVPVETVCEYEVQYRQRLEQERAQWNQYRESVERELGELRRRLTEGQEEENLEDEMKKVELCSSSILRISLSKEKFCTRNITTHTTDLSHAVTTQLNAFFTSLCNLEKHF